MNGPQVFNLDYHTLRPANEQVTSFTLGIAADDFQFPPIRQPFEAKINGVTNTVLTSALNALDQSGPRVQFLTIGLDPALLTANNVLNLSIDEAGDGGDGWAVDFLTVGVTTAPVPIPAVVWLFGSALGGLGAMRRHPR